MDHAGTRVDAVQSGGFWPAADRIAGVFRLAHGPARLEELRNAWLEAPDMATRKAIKSKTKLP